MIFNLLQLLGGIILSIGYIPQILQIIRSKSVKDLNPKTFILVTVGVLMMQVYAVNLVANGTGHAFLFTNTLALVLAIVMLSLIFIYKDSKVESSI